MVFYCMHLIFMLSIPKYFKIGRNAVNNENKKKAHYSKHKQKKYNP